MHSSYPIGLLFGLGFDTATEVALLILAAGAASAALPLDPLPSELRPSRGCRWPSLTPRRA
jgi:hypothetical protein